MQKVQSKYEFKMVAKLLCICVYIRNTLLIHIVYMPFLEKNVN